MSSPKPQKKSSSRPNNRGNRNSNPPKPDATLATRQTALSILRTIFDKRLDLDMAMAQNKHLAEMEDRDRAFVRLLVMTVLRRRKLLSAAYTQFLSKPLPAKQTDLAIVFQIGVAQILYMDVPDYAAVNSTVNLAKANRLIPFSGLVNAVLKKVSQNIDELLKAHEEDTNTIFPAWLKKSWQKHYGEAQLLEISKSLLQEPALDITPKRPEYAEKLAEKMHGFLLNNGSVRVHRAGAVSQLAEFKDGTWWVQDFAASLPVLLLGDIAGKTALDIGAAPGGKTAQLSANGAIVTALDRSEKRLERLEENLARLQLDATVVCEDIMEYEPTEKFDVILLDAPCSATGTLRRHPDLMWQKSGKDVVELAELQTEMINHALTLLKTGGTLLYCTCSLEPTEGELQITNLLENNANVAIEPISINEAKTLGISPEWLTKNGGLRLLPHYEPTTKNADMSPPPAGMDGFFAARVKKIA